MIRVCKENNVELFIVMQIRLNKTIEDLRRKIKEGKFGKIGIFSLNILYA